MMQLVTIVLAFLALTGRFGFVSVFVFVQPAAAAQTSKHHPYRIDKACDVASSAFVPYSGIRIQQARYFRRSKDGEPGDLWFFSSDRKMRASVCLHGARYDQAYADYQEHRGEYARWVDWTAKFCFNQSSTVPPQYRHCFVMSRLTEEGSDTMNVLNPDHPVGILNRCLDGYECQKQSTFATLLSDEAYMAWDRPLDALNQTAVRIPLMYTAELFSDQHVRGTEVSTLCTDPKQAANPLDDGKPVDNKALRLLESVDKLMVRFGYKDKLAQYHNLNSTMLSVRLQDSLTRVFLMSDKRIARGIVEKLAKVWQSL